MSQLHLHFKRWTTKKRGGASFLFLEDEDGVVVWDSRFAHYGRFQSIESFFKFYDRDGIKLRLSEPKQETT